MKLLTSLLTFGCAEAQFRVKLKLCTENGKYQVNANGTQDLNIKFKGVTQLIEADYFRVNQESLLTSEWLNGEPDFVSGTNLNFELSYPSHNVLCLEEIKLQDQNWNEVDIMPYLSFAAKPDWTTTADKVFLLANDCDPETIMNHDGKVRPAAQSDAFRQTCRDTINFTVNSQIDECADGSLNKCDPNAVCTDTQEGYECACNAGFLGTGFMRDFEPKAGCTADPSVPKTTLACNDGDAVKMSVTMPKSLSPNTILSDLADWSDDGNGNYVASWDSWVSSEITEETRTATNGDTYQVLVLTKESDAGCTEATVDGVKVCTKTGHDLSFKCEYSLADQTLDQKAFTVSGSDKEATAEGTGELTYTLTVDNAAVAIGSPITATITPVTTGLVDATITKCSVKHTAKSESVDIIKANLNPVCELGAAIATGQGKENLSFSWNAFKWTTAEVNDADVVESQQVECTIELAKTATVKTIQSC